MDNKILYHGWQNASDRTTLKGDVIGLCEGNPLVTNGLPSQTASNAEMFSFDDMENRLTW